MKRKRPCRDAQDDRPTKRHEVTKGKQDSQIRKVATALSTVHHNVLSPYYHKVCTLRSFLLSQLPTSSRVRRRRLDAYQKEDGTSLLDACLVGVSREPSVSLTKARKDDFCCFTQSQYHATGAFSGKTLRYSMNEVGHFLLLCCHFRTKVSDLYWL